MPCRFSHQPISILSLLAAFGYSAFASAQAAPPSANQAGKASPASPSVTPPRLTHFVEAAQSPEAEALTSPVAVLLEFTVLADGSVENVVVLEEAAAPFDEAATEAAAAFRFEPAKLDGKPTAVRIKYRYVFEPPAPAAPPMDAEPNAAPAASARTSEAPELPTAAGDSPPAIAVGRLHGRVTERGTRKPLIGALVKLPEQGLETLTDADGRFEFDAVAVGRVHITLEDLEHSHVNDHETVVAGQQTRVDYAVDRTSFGEDDLVAVGQQGRTEVTRHAMSPSEVETLPGSNGDALKAVQNLPGVARTNDDSIVLRGGGDTKVFVNGLPLPAAFHFFGLRSTIGSGLLKSVDVTPGNYSAQYGRGNGGLVNIELRKPAQDGLHGFGQVDLFDASAFLEGPVGDHGGFAVGLRRSYIDGVLPLFLDEDGKRLFQSAPRYYDGQAAYEYEADGHRFRAYLLGSSDSLQLMFDEPPESDPGIRGGAAYRQKWLTGQLLWDYRANAQTQHSLGVSYLTGSSEQSVGRDLSLDFTPSQFALTQRLTHQANDWLTLRGGLDLQVDQYNFDVTTPAPAKEGQLDSPLGAQEFLSARGNARMVNPAAWIATDIQLGSLLLRPSLRVDHYSFTNELEGTVAVQPRFDTRWAITDRTALKAGVGYYSEPAELDETNKVFGNPESKPDKSIHYSAGVEQRVGDALSIDVTGFYKHFYDMLSPVEDPAVKYDNSGLGRAYGGEVMLRHDLRSRFYGWLAYTLQRSERKDAGDSGYRLFDTDQTHNLTAVGQYKLSQTWEIGARFRYVTGNPSTPVSSATYDSDSDIYVPRYGAPNSERIGAFHQLDVRVDKHFIFDTWRLTAYLDLQNAYGRQNPEGVDYNYDFSESKPTAGLPLIPSFGVKGEF